MVLQLQLQAKGGSSKVGGATLIAVWMGGLVIAAATAIANF
jgi:hypothetical protein